MCFREKSAWICLVSVLLVQGAYFAHLARVAAAGPLTARAMLPALVLATLVQAIATALGHVALARQASRERRDERDRAIAAAAFRRAYVVFAVAVFCAVFGALGFEAAGVVAATQLAYAAWVLAEVVKYASQAFDYRRGASGLGS
jgi:xanthine/uracil permease